MAVDMTMEEIEAKVLEIKTIETFEERVVVIRELTETLDDEFLTSEKGANLFYNFYKELDVIYEN